MKVLHRVELRRKMMIVGLAKAEMLKGDYHKLLTQLGYDRTKKSLDPTRFKPPVDNTTGYMQKWVQIALNVVLGLNLTIDGVLGPVTRQAIKRLQRREGILTHGYVDDRTLQVLELRTGMRSPRQVEHEGVPWLMRMPRRGIWRPKGWQDKDEGKGKGKGKGKGGPENDQAGGLEAQVADPDAAVDVEHATPGVLQDEAMQAVMASAFSDEFAAEAADELNKPKKAIRKELDAWVQEQRGGEAEDWLLRTRDLARAHPEMAAGIVRRQWWGTREGT